MLFQHRTLHEPLTSTHRYFQPHQHHNSCSSTRRDRPTPKTATNTTRRIAIALDSSRKRLKPLKVVTNTIKIFFSIYRQQALLNCPRLTRPNKTPNCNKTTNQPPQASTPILPHRPKHKQPTTTPLSTSTHSPQSELFHKSGLDSPFSQKARRNKAPTKLDFRHAKSIHTLSLTKTLPPF